VLTDPMRSTAARVVLFLGVGALLVSACGGGDTPTGAATDTAAGGTGEEQAAGSVTVGGPNFTEGLVMTEMYRLLLEDAGYDVTVQTVTNREVYEPALERGEIDVVPEYLATMTEFLNLRTNGPDADPVATSDVQETLDALTELGSEVGLVPLQPAEAANQNAFVVAEDLATENDLSTLSDLAALGEPVVLAATEECPERLFCQIGLEEVYGLQIERVEPLGFGSPQTKQAVADGDATLGLTGTTDGTLESFGLVLLDDDQNLQLADNLVPVVNAEVAQDEALVAALDSLAAVLSTQDLAELNAQVDQERQQASDVAQAYLEAQGLLGG
jgi:osmoprotectant transport system substrate-binding protein